MKKNFIIFIILLFFSSSASSLNYITTNSFQWTNNDCPAEFSINFKNETKYELTDIEYTLIMHDTKGKELDKEFWEYSGSIKGGENKKISGHTITCKVKNNVKTYSFDLRNAVLVEN